MKRLQPRGKLKVIGMKVTDDVWFKYFYEIRFECISIIFIYILSGYLKWESLRSNWVRPVSGQPSRKRRGEIKAISIDPDDIIERIFTSSGNGILPQPIPLPQMVVILIDFWEADGLYD